MTPPDPPLPGDEFLEILKASLQADENDEAVYGWMAEESEEPSAADRLTHTDDAVRTIVCISDQA
jgi:hypothetical protein